MRDVIQKGGMYANGIISATLKSGDVIPINITLASKRFNRVDKIGCYTIRATQVHGHHMGRFSFSICALPSASLAHDATQVSLSAILKIFSTLECACSDRFLSYQDISNSLPEPHDPGRPASTRISWNELTAVGFTGSRPLSRRPHPSATWCVTPSNGMYGSRTCVTGMIVENTGQH